MYNIDIQMHNSYKIEVIDTKTSKVKYSNIYYNTANSLPYLDVVKSTNVSSLGLFAIITNNDIESTKFLGNVAFQKVLNEPLSFGVAGQYQGNYVLSENNNNYTGTYSKFMLGGGSTYLSEADTNFTKELNDRINISITLNITVSAPIGSNIKFFDKEYSILTPDKYFPYAIPNSISVCSIPWKYLSEKASLDGKILGATGYFSSSVVKSNDTNWLIRNGDFNNNNDNGQNFSYDSFNTGTFDSMLLDGIGVAQVGSTGVDSAEIKDYEILDLSYYYGNDGWLTYTDENYAYIFYKFPEGCSIKDNSIKIKNLTSSSNIIYESPTSINSSLTTDETNGDILSVDPVHRNLWKTTDGKVLKVGESINTTGKYFWFSKGFEFVDSEGKKLKPYIIYYNKGVVTLSKTRLINEIGYCFSEIEERIIPNRIFDEDCIRITGTIIDMGGFKIPIGVTSGILTCTLNTPNGKFFKSEYNTATFKYQIGISNGG